MQTVQKSSQVKSFRFPPDMVMLVRHVASELNLTESAFVRRATIEALTEYIKKLPTTT